MLKILIKVTILTIILPVYAHAIGVYLNFDAFPTGVEGKIPGNADGWIYTSKDTNTWTDFYDSQGHWRVGPGYVGKAAGTKEFFRLNNNSYNNSHMGFQTFGYYDFDDKVAVRGKSLKITTTGGAYYSPGVNNVCDNLSQDGGYAPNCDYHGTEIHSKDQYIAEMNAGHDPVYTGGVVGAPRMTFGNEEFNMANYIMPQGYGSNRLSMYIYLPNTVSNQGSITVNDKMFLTTFEVCPWNDASGTAHWYHRFFTQGGGWAHIQVDTHPQHNNAWSNATMWPYPSSSIRNYGVDYWTTTRQFYIQYAQLFEYSGLATPKYDVYLDEMEFQYDSEPQNEETINGLAVLYRPSTTSFEISFSGKYTGNIYDNSTYEIRYSLSQITNSNYSSATPVQIQANTFFSIPANTTGIIKKYQAYRPTVWAPFKIAPEDEALLIPGATLYFAVKDVSQDPNNLQIPNPAYNNGRNYATYGNTFDYAGDAQALPLIKRINFLISNPGKVQPQTDPIIKSIKIIQVSP